MVKRADFVHKYLIYTYKITKNQPLDQIFTPLILLKNEIFYKFKIREFIYRVRQQKRRNSREKRPKNPL